MVYFKSTQAIFSAIVFGLIFIIINSHLLVLSPPLTKDRKRVDCYGQGESTDWVLIYKIIGAFLYSLVPSCLLVLMNSYFLYRALFKKVNAVNPSPTPSELGRLSTKKNMVGLTITIITIGFFICTIPLGVTTVIYKSLWNTRAGNEYSGRLIIFTCDAVSFTYHSAKLEMLLIYNSFFRNEFMKVVRDWTENGKKLKFSIDQFRADSKVTTEYTS